LSTFSTPSTRRSPAVWGLGCPSAVRSLKRMVDDCGRARTCPTGPSLNSPFLPTQTLHREWILRRGCGAWFGSKPLGSVAAAGEGGFNSIQDIHALDSACPWVDRHGVDFQYGIDSSAFLRSLSAANRLNGPKESTSCADELRRSFIRVVRCSPRDRLEE
jgi:hypothetical protein